MAYISISSSQTAAKAPVDQTLMDDIRLDLDFLNTGVSASGVSKFNVNGPLSVLRQSLPDRRRDGAIQTAAKTFSSYGVYLEKPGTSGTLEIDVRKYRTPNTPIIGIDYQYSQAINSIALAGSALNTQSISKATPQVATQSISFWKATINVSSIIAIGGGFWRYNLAAAVDADWAAGDYVTFASCTTGANNGLFQIQRLGDDGGNNVIIYNGNGVAQTGAAGTAQLMAMAYTLIDPADANFNPGESALFASHTTAANNGTFAIYGINKGGNNIIVKNSAGVVQAGVAGTCDALRWTYTYGSAVTATDYVVGETANMASHTTSGNNGNLSIVGVNVGGNNIVVYNVSGALQAGVAGTANTNRWVYALPTDPTSSFSAGQTFVAVSTASSANAGTFTVKQINRSAINNLVVYNTIGVSQVGAAGTLNHTRRVIKFSADQSAIYSTASRAELRNLADQSALAAYDVVEVNRGGGSNFNIVVDSNAVTTQASPCGRVAIESRSLFSTRPSFSITNDLVTATNGVFGTEAVVSAGLLLGIEILQVPLGAPTNLVVQIN